MFAAVHPHPRFTRIESFSPRNHPHAFRVNQLSDIDALFESWIAEAYAVGEQRHLERRLERAVEEWLPRSTPRGAPS